VHLVGFIIRIYHDARSPERQKKFSCIYAKLTVIPYSISRLWENKKCEVQRVARHCDGNTDADNGHLISNTHTTETLQHTVYSDYIHNQLKKKSLRLFITHRPY